MEMGLLTFISTSLPLMPITEPWFIYLGVNLSDKSLLKLYHTFIIFSIILAVPLIRTVTRITRTSESNCKVFAILKDLIRQGYAFDRQELCQCVSGGVGSMSAVSRSSLATGILASNKMSAYEGCTKEEGEAVC
jgi:hypothetical protein